MQACRKDTLVLCRRHGLVHSPEPLNYEQILEAAPVGGALVLPVVTETDAFAFVVVAGSGEAAVISLPMIDQRVVAAHLKTWLESYHDTVRSPGFYRGSSAYQRWNNQIRMRQAWLWSVLLGPIDVHLRQVAGLVDDAPVVLLTPGLLGLLPLQGAGPAPDGRHFCERWTVSLAPSVRSLLICRRRLTEREQHQAKLLAIIDPAGPVPLTGARAEGEMLRGHFAHADGVILEGAEATLHSVLRHLPSATYVHLATHGMHRPLQPQLSQLYLADTPLRLEMLYDTRLDAARLVFLSACESGLAGVRKVRDEYIGMPAGFVQAGAAAVVSSLWPVFDDAAFIMSSRFYKLHLDKDGSERLAPAVALRQAQNWLRQVTFGELKCMFPVQRDADGAYLLLDAAPRTAIPEEIRPLSLPLGPDGACPYAAPHEWAAFTLTGV